MDLQLLLVIDDDVLTHEMVLDGLGEHYRVQGFTDPELALQQVAALQPAVILLDINMPKLDGYEVCRRLKAEPLTTAIPVMFLSGLTALEDCIAAYDAGGEDFMPKPLNLAALHSRLEALRKRQLQLSQLASQASFATETAMTAMSAAAELGLVLQFSQQSLGCCDESALADALLALVARFGLSGAVALHDEQHSLERSQEGGVSEMERGVLQLISHCGRVITMGRRAAFNAGGVTLLVRDMPVDDDDYLGRLRDNFARVVELAAERLANLSLQQRVREREQVLQSLLQSISISVDALEMQRREDRFAATALLESLLTQVEREFVRLGLSDNQEELVCRLLRDASYKVMDLYRGDVQGIEELKRALVNVSRPA